MTDNEIQKALECCCDELHCCSVCPYFLQDKENDFCREDMNKDALDLINHQQAEIERLSKKNEELAEILSDTIRIRYAEAKAEAIEEFAERFLKIVHDNHYLLVDRINSKDYGMFTIGIEQAVDETKKEMVGEG